MRFLFINAINQDMELETKYPPLGLGYLASSLRKKFGHEEVEFKIVSGDIENEIKDFRPDIVGISSVSQNYNRAVRYASTAKKHGLPVLCGGVHITMMPESLTEDMDIGVIGEAEETVCELYELFRREKSFDTAALSEIKGIVYWENGQIRKTAPRELIESLDTLPLPARDLFDVNRNTYMFTSRGCPFKCTFCASTRFWSKTRYFSAEYVVNEISYLIENHSVNRINFYDDLFPASKKRVKEILDLLRERDILGKVEFVSAIRANIVSEELIALLKEIGVVALGMGLESGCEDTLRYLKSGNVTVKDNIEAVRMIKKHDITPRATFIIGSPYETGKDILQTLEFIRKSELDIFEVFVLTPYPGTPVWDYAVSRGLVSAEMDWDRLNIDFASNHNSAIVLSEKLSRDELYQLYQLFIKERKRRALGSFARYYARHPGQFPQYLLKKVSNVFQRLFG